VWEAHDLDLDSTVAIKVLSEGWVRSADVVRRFLDEARMLRRADSDRVVRVHDVGELPDGRPYFVMTYADRGTLADRLADGPLPWPVAVRVAIGICEGLRALHKAGVLHRDLTPSNVLFRSAPDGSEQVLLGDLGLGKLLTEASGITSAGGTRGYAAPEQFQPGATLGPHTDIFAVGAVLYRMLSGRDHDESHRGRRGAPPAVRGFVPGTPSDLDDIVRRALAVEPAQRFPDADTLHHELCQVLDHGEGRTAAKAARPRRSERPHTAELIGLWWWSGWREPPASPGLVVFGCEGVSGGDSLAGRS